MREIVTAVEMKELDHNTIQKAGISSPVLMERAALKTVEEIVQRLKNKEKEKILVVWQSPIRLRHCCRFRRPQGFSLFLYSLISVQSPQPSLMPPSP